MTLTYSSLCSGIEAVSAAWEPLGMKPSWFSEIEKFPCAVLRHHYPGVPNLGDMTKIRNPPKVDILVGGTPCFTKGHLVLTESGYRPIQEIVPGDLVLTHKGRLRPVIKVGSKMSSVGTIEAVGLPDGVVCTGSHPFLSVQWRNQSTKRNNKYVKIEHCSEPHWTSANEMPGKQWCALTEVPGVPPPQITKEDLYIAGFYVGDGFIRRGAGKNKKAVVFGINNAKLAKIQKVVLTKHLIVTRERTGPRVTICNTELAEWLVGNFGEYSHKKYIPAWVLAHPDRGEFLRGYLDTDGHRRSNGWRINSVSQSLAQGVCDLAVTLSMSAGVRLTKTADTTVIEGRTVSQRDYWVVDAFPADQSKKSRVRHGLLLRKVTSFTDMGTEEVFNIEVEEDHSYILNGAIVHNCQAFSVAGLRNGLDDHRGQLTMDFVRIADEIDPRYIIWENVPGVLSSKDNAFGCFLGTLAGDDQPLEPGPRPTPGKSNRVFRWSGEQHVAKWPLAGCVFGPKRTIAWRVLDAQYFGVAQRRRRVFVVASSGDGADPCSILFESDGLRRDSPPSRTEGQGPTYDVAPCIAASGRGFERTGDTRGQDCVVPVVLGGNNQSGSIDVATACNAKGGSGRMDFETESFVVQVPALTGRPYADRGAGDLGNIVCQYGDVAGALTARHDSSPCADRGMNVVATFEPGVASREGGHYYSGICGTLHKNPGDNQMTLHPGMQVRRLTPKECERLQGFKDDYTNLPKAADGPRYKAIGNSMARPCMTFIGQRLLQHDNGY